MWNICLLVILIYTAIVLPLRISFIDDNIQWRISDIIFDTYFMLDIVVNFFSAYEDDYGIIIYKREEIAINYLKTWFLIDLLSGFPIYFITDEL